MTAATGFVVPAGGGKHFDSPTPGRFFAMKLLGRETGAREEWVSYAYGIDLHQHLFTDLSERSLGGLEDFKNFLFQWGFIPENFSIRQWFDPAPLALLEESVRKRA